MIYSNNVLERRFFYHNYDVYCEEDKGAPVYEFLIYAINSKIPAEDFCKTSYSLRITRRCNMEEVLTWMRSHISILNLVNCSVIPMPSLRDELSDMRSWMRLVEIGSIATALFEVSRALRLREHDFTDTLILHDSCYYDYGVSPVSYDFHNFYTITSGVEFAIFTSEISTIATEIGPEIVYNVDTDEAASSDFNFNAVDIETSVRRGVMHDMDSRDRNFL